MSITQFESGAYSLLDVAVSLVGPGVSTSFTGLADEGYSVDYEGDKDTLTMGADGSGMHSLHAAQGGTFSLRLLKISKTNQVLLNAYNFQSGSAVNWGKNIIRLDDSARGDSLVCLGVAFRKLPAQAWARDGNVQEWAFNCTRIEPGMGPGTNEILL